MGTQILTAVPHKVYVNIITRRYQPESVAHKSGCKPILTDQYCNYKILMVSVIMIFKFDFKYRGKRRTGRHEESLRQENMHSNEHQRHMPILHLHS